MDDPCAWPRKHSWQLQTDSNGRDYAACTRCDSVVHEWESPLYGYIVLSVDSLNDRRRK